MSTYDIVLSILAPSGHFNYACRRCKIRDGVLWYLDEFKWCRFVNPPQNTYYIACVTSLLYEKLY